MNRGRIVPIAKASVNYEVVKYVNAMEVRLRQSYERDTNLLKIQIEDLKKKYANQLIINSGFASRLSALESSNDDD